MRANGIVREPKPPNLFATNDLRLRMRYWNGSRHLVGETIGVDAGFLGLG